MNILYNIVIYPLVQIIEFVFVFAQKVFKETGVSIITVSAAVSVLCLPLYNIAENWQRIERDTQKKLKPGIDKIKAVFRGDERYMILSAYYRQNHYHPVYAMRNTFSLLIQIPFFIAAYSYLSRLGALKGAHFLFIADLGAPDGLVKIGGWSINLLPVLMTAINIAAGAVYTKGLPVRDKIQLYGMAAVFLVLLYNSPAGLVLYWIFNNIFSLGKNCYHNLNFRYKNTLLYTLISALLALFAVYILLIYRGNFYHKAILVLTFGAASAFLWIWRVVKRYLKSKEYIKINQKGTTLILTVSSLCLCSLLGLAVPSLLISASPNEFSFIDTYKSPLFFLFNTASQMAGFFVFWPFCLYALFSAKAKESLALIIATAAVFSICNVFLFPGNYGFISVTMEFDGKVDHGIQASIINLLVLIFITLIVLFLLHKQLVKMVCAAFALCFSALLILSTVNIIKIRQTYINLVSYYDGENKTLTEIVPIFHLSQTGKNVVVIMLDKAASVFIPYIFEESPELNDKYSGFIFYPNTVTFAGYTSFGAPPIFGGYEASPLALNARTDVTLKQKHNEALLMMPVLFSNEGYSITVADSPYANYTEPPDMSIYDALPNSSRHITNKAYTGIWLAEHDLKFPSVSETLKRNMFWYSLLRASPYFFRWGIYTQGSWCSMTPNIFFSSTLDGYAVLDYLPRLTDFNAAAENTFISFVNNATHERSFLQAPDYRPVSFVNDYGKSRFRNVSDYHVNAAAIKRLSEWFDYLKDNGVYDNTRIIIVSDHGPFDNYVTRIGLPFDVDHYNPLLMVKDFAASGGMRTDSTFMSNADVPSLALKGLVADPKNPFTGNPINMDAKQTPLYIAVSIPPGASHLAYGDKMLMPLNPKKDYYVHTNIFNPDNWEKAEE